MAERGKATAALPDDDWDGHWTEFGEANERNPAQEYRRELCLFLTGRGGPPQRLLDIGSGNGELLAAAARRWPQAHLAGVELSAVGVRESLAKVPQARIRVGDLIAESEPRPEEVGWATHAVCSEVLEHVDDPETLLRHARGWMAPGGRLIVTVPGGPMSAFDRHIGHRRHFSTADVGSVLEASGYRVTLTAGAGFPFFNVYRAAVIARGEQLVTDFDAGASAGANGVAMRVASALLRPLLTVSLPRFPLGWQTVAVARVPVPEGS